MTKDYSQYTIYLIEDEQLYADYITTILSKNLNITPVVCSNPKIAFEKMENELPSLILLDLEMPVMDGFTALKIIRSTPEYKHIPVIISSALRTKEMLVTLVKHGINDFIEKRSSPAVVLKKISFHLDKLDESSEENEKPAQKENSDDKEK